MNFIGQKVNQKMHFIKRSRNIILMGLYFGNCKLSVNGKTLGLTFQLLNEFVGFNFHFNINKTKLKYIRKVR